MRKLSDVITKRGAPMGRPNRPVSGKCNLQQVRMSSCGAYDHGGAYWGIGDPLYVCFDQFDNEFFTRASSRELAKKNVLEYNESVTFYR